MVQEVYADLYVLINACMDLLCLMLTASLLHRKIMRRRALLGAAVGGLYALGVLLVGLSGGWGIVLDLLAALGICACVFAEKRLRFVTLIKCTAAYALISALLGGIMTVLYTFLNRLKLPLESLRGDGLSGWMLAILAGISALVAWKGGAWLGRSKRTKSVKIEAVILGKPITLLALVDSGNLLRDPVSGRGVIIAEREKLRGVLPEGFEEKGGWMRQAEVACRVRMIPTQTATGSGMLTAIVPDSLTVYDGQGAHPSDYLVAPTDLGGKAKEFDALIPMD